MQTSSVCLRRQLSRRGKPGKGELRRQLLQRGKPRKTKDSRGVGTGKAGKRLVRRLEQTSSVCLRRQLPRRGKPGKGELRRALLQRRIPRKERKTAVASERAKRGKGWCGGWSRPLQSAYADSFPEGGSREKTNCADSFPEGEAEKGRIAQSASTEREAEKGTIPRRAGIKIDEVYTHIRLRIRENRFCKAIL